MGDDTGIDYSRMGLNFILCRYEVLYNRAVSFVALNLLHRSRDDLLAASALHVGQIGTEVIKTLLAKVNKDLKEAPVSWLAHSRYSIVSQQKNTILIISIDLQEEEDC